MVSSAFHIQVTVSLWKLKEVGVCAVLMVFFLFLSSLLQVPLMRCVIRQLHLHSFNDSSTSITCMWLPYYIKMQNINWRDSICYTIAPVMVTYICSDFQEAFVFQWRKLSNSRQKFKKRRKKKEKALELISHYLCSHTVIEVICKRPAQFPL